MSEYSSHYNFLIENNWDLNGILNMPSNRQVLDVLQCFQMQLILKIQTKSKRTLTPYV